MRLVASPGESASPGLWRGLTALWAPMLNTGRTTMSAVGNRPVADLSKREGRIIAFSARDGWPQFNHRMTTRPTMSVQCDGQNDYWSNTAAAQNLMRVNNGSSVFGYVYLVDYTYATYPKVCCLKSDGGDGEPWQLGVSAAGGYEGVICGTPTTWARCKTGTALTTNAAYAIAVVYNGGTASSTSSFRMWINGQEQTIASASGFGSAGTNGTYVGREPGGANEWYGNIAMVGSWSRPLSSSEAKAITADPYTMFRRRPLLSVSQSIAQPDYLQHIRHQPADAWAGA